MLLLLGEIGHVRLFRCGNMGQRPVLALGLIHLRMEARLEDAGGLLLAKWQPTSTHVPSICT